MNPNATPSPSPSLNPNQPYLVVLPALVAAPLIEDEHGAWVRVRVRVRARARVRNRVRARARARVRVKARARARVRAGVRARAWVRVAAPGVLPVELDEHARQAVGDQVGVLREHGVHEVGPREEGELRVGLDRVRVRVIGLG